MTLDSFLYLAQLEEYEIPRILSWLHKNPEREVPQIKKKLIWTFKIILLNFIAKTLFFLPPEKSVVLGLRLLTPFDIFIKLILTAIAWLKLRLLHPRLTVIAVTGSWGKTTVKSSLKHLIGSKYSTFATIGNHNTLLGVALDILKMPLSTKYFICEIGAYYPGDIRAVSRLVAPKIGIITAIGPMHLERFGTIDNILKTKMELAQSIGSKGTVYLPSDIRQRSIHFPLRAKNIIYFQKIDEVYDSIAKLTNISNYHQIISAIPPVEHRQQIIKNGTITIIDDTYNSNPAGFERALKHLKSQKSSNKILVTPGMIELGASQDPENTRLARLAGTICQHVVVVGKTNKEALLAGLKKSPAKVHPLASIAEAEKLLPSITSPDAAILFENDLPDHYF